MNIKISIAGLVAGALLLPVAGYTADATKPSVTEKVKENVGDAVITTKIKAEFAKDKQVSAMNINVDTDNKGVVTLRGTVKSKAEADKAVAIAKDTAGVTAVRNELQFTSTVASTGTMGKTASADTRGPSAQPVDDTVITTRVKARMATDKLVDAGNISVNTVNGVVELRGTASSRAEADKAVAIARGVPDVKSVKSDIRVTSTASSGDSMSKSGASMSKSSDSTAKRSDPSIDDTLITTRVKARMVTDKLVDAGNISVTTNNGVVELRGTASSRAEADKAVAIARAIPEVKSVKSDIRVTGAASSRDSMSRSGDSMSKSGDTAKRSDQPIDDTLITTRVKARMATDKQVSATTISVKTVNGVVELSGTANSKAEASQAVTIARGVDGVKSVKNDIQVK